MPVEDMQMSRRVQREISKRASVDSSLINLRSIHGVVYISGRIRPVRGAVNVNLEEELHIIAQNIKRIPGVRDVVMEVSF